jgi:hypothetical protein
VPPFAQSSPCSAAIVSLPSPPLIVSPAALPFRVSSAAPPEMIMGGHVPTCEWAAGAATKVATIDPATKTVLKEKSGHRSSSVGCSDARSPTAEGLGERCQLPDNPSGVPGGSGHRETLRRRLAHILPVALAAAAGGCAGDDGSRAPAARHVDPGDTLRTQGVEIVDGRFVPDLVAVGPAQAINFLNRDDVPHRIVKVSGPGQDFRSGVIEAGETYRLSLVGSSGWRLRSGTVTYRSDSEHGARGRIEVYGTVIPRRDEPRQPASERTPPEWPDWAAQARARGLAEYVSQCDDFRRCDTPREFVDRVGNVKFVPGSGRSAVESAVSTHGAEIAVARGPDETAIAATLERVLIIGRSRTGRDFIVEGAGRDPAGWTTRCAPRGEGACGPDGEWR